MKKPVLPPDWGDFAVAIAAAVVAVLALAGAAKCMLRGDTVIGVLLCVLSLAVALPGLWLCIRKFREGDQ